MESNSNTIFDDVFRTMFEKMPSLIIPLINEVFHTSYPDDVEIVQLRNEYHDENGKTITDSSIIIGNYIYHIECQSTDDSTMAIRMVRYDFQIAFEHAKKDGRTYSIEFPRSCVLFLRSSGNTPDFLEVNVSFPDNTHHMYRCPTIKLEDYTKDAIFQKNLLFLLPYYVMRYEKKVQDFAPSSEKLKSLLDEYEDICHQLGHKIGEDRPGLYTDMIKLIVKISDYIFRDNQVVGKELHNMGGKVLELDSERLRQQDFDLCAKVLAVLKKDPFANNEFISRETGILQEMVVRIRKSLNI